MEDLIRILEEIKPGVEFTPDTKLFEDKILDSLSMISLIAEISDEFDVDITPEYLIPENFATVKTVYDLIEKLEEE